MKNTKRILAFISIFAIAASFAACSKDGGSNTDSTNATTAAADSTTPESTGAENSSEQAAGATQGGPPTVELQEIAMSPEFAEKCLNKVDYPTFSAKADTTVTDYAGSWACAVMTKGEYLAYDAIFEVPLTATDHLIISEDGTGVVQLVKDSSTTNETPFTYTIEDGKLIATVQVRTGPPAGAGSPQSKPAQAAGQPGEDSGTPANAGNPQGGPPALTVVMQMSEDGQLVINGEDADGDATSAFYNKVDSFDAFDFESVSFDYTALTR